MDKDTRNAIERATQRARMLLEDDFGSQLEGTFDVLRTGAVAATPGPHLTPRQIFDRDKIVAAIEHKRNAGMDASEAVMDYQRDAAFTVLNRFVALKMLEARELVQECIAKGERSVGYREFCGLAPGIALLPESGGYRLYIESLFDELSTEVKVLFDRRDPPSVLWPKRATFEALLEVLNATELFGIWGEDETIGWVYQFFNSKEERAAMRDTKQGGSQAPRNSRELAVRNQFFTPRYVVEFLVDNTLGRIWLEMYGESSALAVQCRYFVRSEGEPTQTRPRKDPRDLRILDPACGSGHFLLYCFDLLLTIYEEAWAAEASCVRSHATGRTLRDDYADLANLRRVTPALILEHNLHGVDIDPRAAQIAALALWLRAQRAWKGLRLPAPERPTVNRTHIVVAEPMPGDNALVEEFAARLDPPLLRDLFRKMVSEMRLAGELGTLVPVEEGIAAELTRAREQFVKQKDATGFFPGMEPDRKRGELDLSGIDDDRFFHEAEARMADTLRHFAEAVAGRGGVRRRLFAGDATEGIALIELLRTRFDVLLMNPPFGAASLAAKKEFERAYPRTRNDIFAAFVERGVGLLHPHALLGAITSRTGFFLPSFQQWREGILLKEAPPVVVADLGYGVMDAAMVEAAAYCLEKGPRGGGMKTVFLRLLEADNKATALLDAVDRPEEARGRQRFEVTPESFASIPRSPFAYWVSDKLRRLFKELPSFETQGRTAAVGLQSSDDFRFLRLWWEVGNVLAYFGNPKGGQFSRFYADVFLVVAWMNSGREVKAFAEVTPGSNHWSRNIRSADQYFRAGLTWSHRTTSGLSLRAMPARCIFGSKGPAVLVENDDAEVLLSLLAITNSSAFGACVALQLAAADAAARSYDVGVIQRTPVPELSNEARETLAALARRAWSLKRSLDGHRETSHAFALPALVGVTDARLTPAAAKWSEHVRTIEAELASIQNEIDQRCFALYGIDEADRRAITEGFDGDVAQVAVTGGADEAEDDADESDGEHPCADIERLATELASWAVGTAFGRFDVRLASGARLPPDEPGPFDPLPVCSPAMLTGDDGMPLVRPPEGYPLSFPEMGILVDDPGHPLDLSAAVRAVFDVVFRAGADDWWNDAAALLDPKGHDFRFWLGHAFFEQHLKRHSKSRRKAPIFWQLGTPSGRYGVWIYAHRLTRDSFFQLQNDVVGPKLTHEERQLERLMLTLGTSPSAPERKKVAAQEALVEELRTMLDEVKRVAPLWNPNLDDGVALTMAPLWRLVPQYRPWQKELKSRWEELVHGKYDWSHIAMHLWPERVVPNCATDRSLAIAHGLEHEFWVEATDGKWKPRARPLTSVDELVRERSSPAVKAALRSLLDSPTVSGTGRAQIRRGLSRAPVRRGR